MAVPRQNPAYRPARRREKGPVASPHSTANKRPAPFESHARRLGLLVLRHNHSQPRSAGNRNRWDKGRYRARPFVFHFAHAAEGGKQPRGSSKASERRQDAPQMRKSDCPFFSFQSAKRPLVPRIRGIAQAKRTSVREPAGSREGWVPGAFAASSGSACRRHAEP